MSGKHRGEVRGPREDKPFVGSGGGEVGKSNPDVISAAPKPYGRVGTDAAFKPHGSVFRFLGEVFVPIIPAFIIAGIANGFATLLLQLAPSLENSRWLSLSYKVLVLVNHSFVPLMNAWIGYLVCEKLGGTPILGGMMGALTSLDEIEGISSLLHLEGVLHVGTGGVIAAFAGAALVAVTEKAIHRHMNRYLDLVLTPMLTLFIVILPYVLLVMPLAGFLSVSLCRLMDFLGSGDTVFVKIIAGFLAAAIFLPANVAGLQHGIMALYPIQLEQYGYISLYPVFSMAGAGQVGAGLAVALLAHRTKNRKLANLAFSAVFPGMLGVAGPLIYGVTLPNPRAFLSSCLGAGVGGAFILCNGVVSTGWGPSGLLALPMMVGGGSALMSIALYLCGLAISCTFGFLLCLVLLRPSRLKMEEV